MTVYQPMEWFVIPIRALVTELCSIPFRLSKLQIPSLRKDTIRTLAMESH